MADTSHYAHCRTLMMKFKKNHFRRLILTAIVLVLNFYVHVLTFGVKYGGPSFEAAQALGVGVSMLPFGMGMATLICSIIALVLAFFTEVQRQKLVFFLIGLIVLCALADFIHWLLAALIVVCWLTHIKDLLNFRWVKEQPGYPHFSERFEEQLENSEYKPMHKMDNKREAKMTDLAEGEVDYSLEFGKREDEMPGISEIFLDEPAQGAPGVSLEKHHVSLEKQVQSAPDPITDTSSILSDPTENFPDLPDIPDIPKL